MPEFPIDPEFGRFIDPIEDQEEDSPLDDPEGELVELEDGSAEFVEKVEEKKETNFSENLATVLSPTELSSIAIELIDLVEKDQKTRQKRDEQYEEGVKRTGLGEDAPGGADFSGASRIVHPALAQACIDFSSRIIKELMPPEGPVKTAIFGEVTDEKLDRAERKKKHLNWQLTKKCPEYRSELEQALSQVGLAGSQFMKIWWEGKRPRFEFVPIDDLHLPYYSSGLRSATRFTHSLRMNRVEFDRRVKRGMYVDLALGDPSDPEKTSVKEATDAVEGSSDDGYNDDGVRILYEIHVLLEIEGDKLADEVAPYIITIDKDSGRTLSIYRNWREEDPDKNARKWMVELPFIPWRGAYTLGFIHLIGSLASGATGALRALLDSAHINNLPGGIKLKGSRFSGQSVDINPTQLSEIEGPPGADDIRKVVMGLPFNPPSQVLYELLGFLTSASKEVVQTAEDKLDQVGDRTPVGTTMALVEAGGTVYSSIHSRLHAAQAEILEILCELNADNMEDEETILELDGLVVSREDYRQNSDIVPVSDPHIFSDAQRYSQLQAVFQMAADPSVPYKKVMLHRRMLKLLRVPNPDEILSIPEKASKIDPIMENVKTTRGEPIKAFEDQDHLAHIQAHLLFATGPIVQGAQLMQSIAPLVAHVQEHMVMLYQNHAQAAYEAAAMSGKGEGEEIMGSTQLMVMQSMTQQLGPLMQMLQQAKQSIPPQEPPMDPQSAVALKIGMAEVERKKAFDQASLKMQSDTSQLRSSMEQAKLQMDGQRQQFDQFQKAQQMQFQQYMESMRAELDQRESQLAQQVELVKNQQDNHQHQMTELMKNKDDNETKLMIAQIQQQLDGLQQTNEHATEQAPDFAPQLEQMNKLLGEIKEAKTNEALQSVMMGLQTVISEVGRPKVTKIIRDEGGNMSEVRQGYDNE